MGQLEKYGLYVLCLVICLILGVAIWGGDPGSATIDRAQLERTAAEANARRNAQRSDENPFAPVRSDAARPPANALDLETVDEPPPAPAPANNNGGPGTRVTPVPATYTVKKGETIEEIAIAQLGSRARMRDLLVLNPEIKDPKKDVREGMKLRLPHGQVLPNDPKVAADPKDAGERKGGAKEGVWKVRDGDNPHKIAAAVLEKPVRSTEVARFAEEMLQLNHISDETKLKIGLELRLPPVKK